MIFKISEAAAQKLRAQQAMVDAVTKDFHNQIGLVAATMEVPAGAVVNLKDMQFETKDEVKAE